ncbi:hypothetical protein ABZW11_17245 [Nonomuraea sp. NPDC004580]|uniref:hypothetical protein n=1 Tax=Nonomuraea sp. NPDC004580 TaxID=3154552 RepID=UPI0033ADE2FE
MLRRILAALAVAFLALAVAGPSTAAAADVPGLRIGTVGYNAYGADVASNRNSEFVEVVADDTAPAEGVNVAGLLVQDAWARGRDKTTGCNTFTLKPGVLPVEDGQPGDVLPKGATLRVHMGPGAPAIDAGGVRHVYADMSTRCGYNGHIFNNGPGSNRWADWDRAWITLDSNSESKPYNFTRGYVA